MCRHFGQPGLGIQLRRPVLPSGESVTGANKRQWKKVTKRRRRDLQMEQRVESYWTAHDASFTDQLRRKSPSNYRGGMCPSNLALHHPAADLLKQYATEGCPVDTGRHWTKQEIVAAIERGNHPMEPSAMQQFHDEALAKQERGLVEIIDWEALKALPDDQFPKALKSSPLSAVPHKSRGWRAILDLSWVLKWEGGEVQSVNAASTKLAPRGAIDQIGHSLQRLIHAMATAPDGKKVYMAKWDVKDGFWQMVAARGAEWNFCFVLPQEPGKPLKIVKPTSLQMGWLESPPFLGWPLRQHETSHRFTHRHRWAAYRHTSLSIIRPRTTTSSRCHACPWRRRRSNSACRSTWTTLSGRRRRRRSKSLPTY